MSEWKKTKKEYYQKDCIVQHDGGIINFSPDSMAEVEKGAFRSYDEYLEVQRRSCRESRKYFEMCYYHPYVCDYKGRIDRYDSSNGKLLFQRIMIDGMYNDGIGFRGKEDHVWMDAAPFADYEPGDCIGFDAEIYRYMKQGNGKLIDYGLRFAANVHKIDGYEVPTDEDLVNQQIDQLVCETCRYYDHCFMGNCIANEDERRKRTELLKSLEPGKFTERTVMLAYELEYRMFLQMGGFRLDKKDKNYPVMKRLVEICSQEPVYYTGDIEEALMRMTMPEKPRMYIE